MPSSGCKTCALDRKSTRLNSSHTIISYAVFCLKKTTPRAHYTPQPPWRGGTTVSSPGPRRCGGTGRSSARRRGLRRGGCLCGSRCFFFNDPATTEIYTLSLHDALPINDPATTEIYTLSLPTLPISVVAVS